MHKNRVRSLHGLSRWQAAIIEWCICVRRQFQPNVITHEVRRIAHSFDAGA